MRLSLRLVLGVAAATLLTAPLAQAQAAPADYAAIKMEVESGFLTPRSGRS
jgi:hypothetical protein